MSLNPRFFGLALALTLAACGGTTATDTTTTNPPPVVPGRVAATPSLVFSPSTLTLNAGETATFAFGSVGHNVTFDARTAATPADISGINANVSITRVFPTAGTYNYHCTIHPGMAGSVVVH